MSRVPSPFSVWLSVSYTHLQAVGQLCFEEVAQDDVIVGIGQGYLIQIVGIHKLVEHIGTEHDGCLLYTSSRMVRSQLAYWHIITLAY